MEKSKGEIPREKEVRFFLELLWDVKKFGDFKTL